MNPETLEIKIYADHGAFWWKLYERLPADGEVIYESDGPYDTIGAAITGLYDFQVTMGGREENANS